MTRPATGDAVCRVERVEPVSAPHRHPLATKTGVTLLVDMLAADQHFRPLPRRQRDALCAAYHRALDGAADGDTVPLPALPDGVHPASVRALERRGLVADGRLTPLAVEVVRNAEPLHRKHHPEATTEGS